MNIKLFAKVLVLTFLCGMVVSCEKDYVSEAGLVGDAVDLGLSVNWASWNVGASAPEKFGNYFEWGEIEYNKKKTDWFNYKWCAGSNNSLTKYCSDKKWGAVTSDCPDGFEDGKTVLELADDAANAIWGGKWRMPTVAEWEELNSKCKWVWEKHKGMMGYTVTGPNGKSIFLPAAGSWDGEAPFVTGQEGHYWSGETKGVNDAAESFVIHSEYHGVSTTERIYCYSVRAVCKK